MNGVPVLESLKLPWFVCFNFLFKLHRINENENKHTCVSLIEDNDCNGYFGHDGILEPFFPLWSSLQHSTPPALRRGRIAITSIILRG